MSKRQTNVSKVVRTSAGLRSVLFEELDGIRSGSVAPARANAISRNIAQIIGTVRLEMEHQRLMASLGHKGSKNALNGAKRIELE